MEEPEGPRAGVQRERGQGAAEAQEGRGGALWGEGPRGEDGAAPTCLTAALKAPSTAAAPPQSLFIPGMVVCGWHRGTRER